MEYTHIHIHPWTKSKKSNKNKKYSWLTKQTKKIKNYIYQLRTKLTKAQTGKENYIKVPTGVQSNENKTNKYVERKGKKEKKERIDMQS